MDLNLVMLGPPGAGKGTQARQLRRKWNIPHISTGAMLRDAVQAGTQLGREVAVIMESGGLISDEVITRVVAERLSHRDAQGGFLLDGYPRTIVQAESLDRMISGRTPLIVIDIVLSEAEVIRRLASRMVCAECGANAVGEGPVCHDCGGPLVPRADDREQVVLNRLKVYREQTEPLVAYYGGRPTYFRIDGARLPDDVTVEIIRTVESKMRAGD
jgi:adenylate kinase